MDEDQSSSLFDFSFEPVDLDSEVSKLQAILEDKSLTLDTERLLETLKECFSACPTESLNEEIFKKVLPKAQHFLSQIVESINDIITGDNARPDNLDGIQGKLQACDGLLSFWKKCVEHVSALEKVRAAYITSLCDILPETTRIIFEHCKASPKYGALLSGTMQELRNLFAKSSAVFKLFFATLNGVIVFDTDVQSETELLTKVVDAYGTIASIANGMDTKTFVELSEAFAKLAIVYQSEIDSSNITTHLTRMTKDVSYLLSTVKACWVMHYFSDIKFKSEQILVEAVRLITNALLSDRDLPVKVEAAIALQMMLSAQPKAQKYIEPLIKEITLELLLIIRKTENDDLTSVMQKIVCTYTEQLIPIAVEVCQHLATTFSQVLETDEGSDEKAITAMGLLNTIETILTVMDEQPHVMLLLEPIVLQVVAHIFGNSVMEFYEEALSLVYDLTGKGISEDMWKVLELIYQLFQKDGFDYFTDMMPALHNYVTIDTMVFLSNENHILAMFNMCKAVLTGEGGEDPECHAAKLLEVIILQCKGHIDQCIPSLVQLVLERLMREVKTSELRTMCLQVVIAALYYNPALCLHTMDGLQANFDQSTEPLASRFIKQWINDTDCFLGLHDRKLCVLGLCTLINMGPARPPAVNECATQIIPSLILLFEGLKRAYAAKVTDTDDDENDDEESDIDEEVLSSDEDDIDDANQEYLEKLQDKITRTSGQHGFNATIQDCHGDHRSDDDDDSEYDGNEETALESYTTPLDSDDSNQDEYVIFKEVIQNIERTDVAWYRALTSLLNPEQEKALQEIIVLADQRKAALESKRIEQSGGYVFHSQTVPTSFNFGGTPLSR